MAKRLRLGSRHSSSVRMADEEQPFLESDPWNGKRLSEKTGGVRRWINEYVYRMNRSRQAFMMTLIILVIIAISAMYPISYFQHQVS
jgi:hypothetical protein